MIVFMGETFSPASLGTTGEAVKDAIAAAKNAVLRRKQGEVTGGASVSRVIELDGVTVVVRDTPSRD